MSEKTFLDELNNGFKWIEAQNIKVFHGSKDGLDGYPKHNHKKARETCDFGKGFYTGDNREQVMGFVSGHSKPVLYEYLLDFSGINHLHVEGMAWPFVVASLRRPEKFVNHENLLEIINNYISHADIISRKIADDNITVALNRFFGDVLTDVGLDAALTKLEWGNQYVLKTEVACSKLFLLSESAIDKATRKIYIENSIGNRDKGIELLDKMQVKYARNGKFFSEIMEELKDDARDIQKFPL